jgi:Ku protein
MAPRANWKGFLRLSLVTCPVILYPATSDSEKISFNQINRKTGHRIEYAKVDADTGEEVSNDDIMKGYKVDSDTYSEVSKDELENIALESNRTIDIDEFVPKSDIDPRYLIRPYYLVPDGKVGHDAFAVIRETIRSMDMVAIGRVVLTSREHIIALEPLENGLMGTLLRYPYEVRDEKEYFDDIQDVKVTKDTHGENLNPCREIAKTGTIKLESGRAKEDLFICACRTATPFPSFVHSALDPIGQFFYLERGSKKRFLRDFYRWDKIGVFVAPGFFPRFQLFVTRKKWAWVTASAGDQENSLGKSADSEGLPPSRGLPERRLTRSTPRWTVSAEAIV